MIYLMSMVILRLILSDMKHLPVSLISSVFIEIIFVFGDIFDIAISLSV